MASIRTRITGSYALALAGTMFVFSVAVGYERNQSARQDLIDRATTSAELAARILRQAGVESERITIFNDSLTGRQLMSASAGTSTRSPTISSCSTPAACSTRRPPYSA